MIIRVQRHVQLPVTLSRPVDRRPRLLRWVVRHRVAVVASCAGAVAFGAHALHPGTAELIASPAAISARTSSTAVAFGMLPAALSRRGTATWTGNLATLDTGIRAAITADRRAGFQMGAVQQFSEGARSLRLVLRGYASAQGAEAAYRRQARYLSTTLPDPSLHTALNAVAGVGGPAMRAIYTSRAAAGSYTVSTLLFRRGRLMGQIDAFPTGARDGNPAADSSAELAIAKGVIDRPGM